MLKKSVKIAIIASTSLVVGAGATTAIVLSELKKDSFESEFYTSGPALPSLNYVLRNDTAMSQVYGFFMEGMYTNQPSQKYDELLSKIVNKGYHNYVPYTQVGNKVKPFDENKKFKTIKEYKFQSGNFSEKNSYNKITGDINLKSVDNHPIDFSIANNSIAVAPGMVDIIEQNVGNGGREDFRARVSSDAFWSNGDKVTAQDFVDTIKYMLDVKNASLATQVVYQTIGLRNAKKIIDEQLGSAGKKPKPFAEVWEEYKKNDELPVRVDGKDNRWVHYFFENGKTLNSISEYLGGSIFMPINSKFVEQHGGILKYGQTKDSILSNGPYEISSLDLDYLITFKRNKHYHLKEYVFMDNPAYKVNPSLAIQMQLFKDGKLANMGVSPELLTSFYSDPKLAPLLKHGATSPTSSGLLFSRKYAQDHKNSPINNINFRKAIQYAFDRNKYAKFINAPGSAPSNSLFAPRDHTKINDESGKTYNTFLMNSIYKEKDPINGKIIETKFDEYDEKSKNDAIYSLNHNREFHDFMYQKELALHFLQKYIDETGDKNPTFELTIVASDENKYLAIKNLLNDTFGNKLNVTDRLLAPQLMTQSILDGNYQAIFNLLGTTIDDPWTLYSKFVVEDGYNDKGKPYIKGRDAFGNVQRGVDVTSNYWSIPGYNIAHTLNKLSAQDKIRLGITQIDIDAAKELETHKEPSQEGDTPNYKYSVKEKLSDVTSWKRVFDSGTNNPDDKINLISPYRGYKGEIKSMFKTHKELFKFYADIEKLLRYDAWFTPLLTAQSSFFVDRRANFFAGNQQGLPAGARTLFAQDNIEQQKRIKERYKKMLGIEIEV